MTRNVLLALIVCWTAVGFVTRQASAKGTPWCITFKSDADADGGDLTLKLTLNNGSTVTVELELAGGTEASAKALAAATVLDDSAELMASVDPNNDKKVKVEVQDNWPTDGQIKKFEVTENTTGEKVTGVKDDPAGIIVTIELDITGFGVGREDGGSAEAVLGIGDEGPLATVSTLDRTGSEIEIELADAFNALYQPTYIAMLDAGKLVVRDVPCELGSQFGSDDNGLIVIHSTTRTTPFGGIPAVSAWGLFAMTLLALTAGTILFRRSGVGAPS